MLGIVLSNDGGVPIAWLYTLGYIDEVYIVDGFLPDGSAINERKRCVSYSRAVLSAAARCGLRRIAVPHGWRQDQFRIERMSEYR